MSNDEKEKTKEIRHEVLKTLHSINFKTVKFPRLLDESKELKSSDEVLFGPVRQEIFQDGEDVINEQDANIYSKIHNNQNGRS